MTPEIKQRIEQIRRGEVPEGYQRTFLGIAPKSWGKSRIDKICRLSSGSTPRRDAVENFAGDILWVTSGELKRRTIEDTREKISETAVVNSHLEIYDPGTVVIAIYGLEAAGIRGTVSIIGKQCTISQACMAFTEFKGIDNEFFYYWYLNNGQVIGLRYAQGTKQQNLSTDIVGSFPICFPSQGEQQKIAAILTTQDKVIELKEKRLAEKQRQKKYLMQQLLTGKKRLPGFSGKWIRIRIGNSHYTKIDYDSLTNNTNKDFEFEYITLENVSNGFLKETIHCTFETAPSRARRVVHKDDILYGTVRPNLHSHLLAGELLEGMVCSTGFCVIQCNPSHLLPYFLYSAIFLEDIDRQAKRIMSGSNYPAISNSDVKNMKIDIPCNIKEQEAITSVLSAADREINLLRQDIEQEKQKKKALMQLLLTGIVRVKT